MVKILQHLPKSTNLRWTYSEIYKEFPRKLIKIFLNDSNDYAGDYPYKWPFVDIFFYDSNATHLWYKTDKRMGMSLRHVFPLKLRPFGKYWLPSPNKPGEIFKASFGGLYGDVYDECKSGTWNHRAEIEQESIRMHCEELATTYPFVSHTCNQKTCTESLVMNRIVLSEIEFENN